MFIYRWWIVCEVFIKGNIIVVLCIRICPQDIQFEQQSKVVVSLGVKVACDSSTGFSGYFHLPAETYAYLASHGTFTAWTGVQTISRCTWWVSSAWVWPRCFSRISSGCASSYPGLRGWTQEQINAIRLDRRPLIDLSTLAMLQSWLFFGLLESIFPRRLASKDWIFNTPNGPIVRTHNLRKIMCCAHRFISKSDSQTQERYARIFHRGFIIAQYWNRHLFIRKPGPHITLEIFDAVRRLTMILRETLNSILVNFPSQISASLSDFGFLLHQGKDEQSLYKMLQAKGWCKSLFQYLSDDLGHWTAEYAALIGGCDTWESSATIHGKCSFDECVARKIDTKNYTPKHVTMDCKCKFRRPMIDQIIRTYDDESFPLINLAAMLDKHTSSAGCVPPFYDSADTPFVALSHVWSDGLCSDANIGFPTCQISNLQELVALYKTDCVPKLSLIYIDTICIPRGKAVKTKAINIMGQVYETASVTIVLDSSLKAISVNSSSTAKLVVRLLTSPSNHRLWTFQEARLAHKLVFVFQDGLCEIGKLWGQARRDIPAPISLQCRLMLERISKGTNSSLSSIAMLLRRRSTSNPADEFPAVAQVFKIQTKALTSKEGLERCCEFWIQLANVPCSIVFQTQEKIPRDGFRWAPQSLVGSKASTPMGDEEEAVVTTKDDLRGTYNLLIFSKSHYFDLTLHRNYHLISVSRRQVFRLTGLSWALHKLWCDAVRINHDA